MSTQNERCQMFQEGTEHMLITFKIEINRKKRLTLKTLTLISNKLTHSCSHMCNVVSYYFHSVPVNLTISSGKNKPKGTSKDTQ